MLRTEGGSWEEVNMENAEVKDLHTIFYRTRGGAGGWLLGLEPRMFFQKPRIFWVC